MSQRLIPGANVRVWPRDADLVPPGNVLVGTIREVSRMRAMLVVVFQNGETRRVAFDEIESVF